MKFDEYLLQDVIESVIDNRGITPEKKGGVWSDSGYKVISAKNIKTSRIVNKDSIRFINEELYKKWMPNEIRKYDILLTSEAPCGEVFLWDSDEKITLGQRIFGLRCNPDFDPRYIYYYMCSRYFQGDLLNRNSGTTVQGIRQKELLKCKILAPSLKDQEKIADILYNIEEKIKINDLINANLGGDCFAL